jgi:hypothetical protein
MSAIDSFGRPALAAVSSLGHTDKEGCGVHSHASSSDECMCDDGYEWVSDQSNDCVAIKAAAPDATPPVPGAPPMPWRIMALGTVVGAGVGGLIGWRKKSPGVGAGIGAGVGALLGHVADNAAARIQ